MLDVKIKEKKLVNEPDISRFINNSDLANEIKSLATKAELKADKDKIVKLQAYDLSLFIGYFVNDGAWNYLRFQPLCYTLKQLGNTEKVVSWKSKHLLTQKFITPTTTDNNLSPIIKWYENSNFCFIFKGRCLKEKSNFFFFQI